MVSRATHWYHKRHQFARPYTVKRFILAITVIALLTLGFLGNRIAGRTLDAELAPLLTRILGLPVQLAPIRARLIPLRAYSDKLVMGDADKPAVVATDVEVGLSWPDLIRGEIRLVYASATDLMVQPSRWPSSGSPAPTDYDFLEQWLPRNLLAKTGKYTNETGESYPVQELHWRRQASGSASVSWNETRPAGEISLDAQLHSLEDLLHLAPIALDLAVKVAGESDSQITLKTTVQREKSSAYTIEADLQATDMNAHIVATGQTAWSLPEHSDINIPLLEPDKVLALFKHYSATDTAEDTAENTATRLAATLPRLELPAHQSQVVIKEIRSGDEVARNASFEVTSGEQGIQVSDLTVNGPMGILTGTLGIVSDAQGWATSVNASVKARAGQSNLAANYVGTDWLWQSGQTSLKGKGTTWGSLLNSLEGGLSLAGEYAGKVPTPIEVTAQLDNHPGALTLDQMSINVGDGHISGSATLSGKEQHKLTMDLKGEHVHLGFLFEEEDAQPEIGVSLPEYLTVLPTVELDVTLNVTDLEAPGLSLAKATAKLERTEEGGKLVATASGKHYGTLELTLAASTPANQPGDFKLDIQFTELDLPDMFKQQDLVYSRTSGSMHFASSGDGMKEIFSAMQGHSELTVRVHADDDWQRASKEYEKLTFSGDSRFVLDNDQIVGIQTSNLDLDSIQQDLTGELSLVAGRNPWLVANLEAKKLDVNALLALLPQSDEGGQKTDLLQTIKSFGATQVSLNAAALILSDVPVTDVELEIVSSPDTFTVKQLDFTAEKTGALKSHGTVSWEKDHAKLEGIATLSNINLDQFLIHTTTADQVPVSGSARLLSEGKDMDDLLGNLTGYIDLHATASQQGGTLQARRKLEMKATQLPDGMEAEITTLQWGESELTGSVHYQRTTPALIDIKIHGGSVSLLPWETAYLNANKKAAEKTAGATMGSAAKTSAKFVGNVLLTPLKFFTGGDNKKVESGDKMFSNDPLPLDSLKTFNLKISGHLDSLLSTQISAQDMDVTASLANGLLDVKASSGKLGGGTGELTLAVDANAVPPTIKLDSNFEQVRGLSNDASTYPRSGMVSMETRGNSEAQFAANTSGLIYLELGTGPFDYANSALLTTNVASTVFSTLIPGIEKEQPRIDCGVTVGLFKAGLGATPYGFAARTDQANLLGKVEIDLISETMQMSLDSRGRHGIGLSVGSVFSNSIQIRGPLTDPSVVPDTTSLIWRGWAAFMTGGLSILGESVVKRVLASDNPCTSTKKIIQKDLCPKNPIAAASTMVCPQG